MSLLKVAERQDFLFSNRKHIISFPGHDPVSAGKTTEGRQDTIFFGKVKAGEPKRLFPFSCHGHSRMHVTGENKLVILQASSRCGDIVYKQEWLHGQEFCMYGDPRFLVPRTTQDIMVAFGQMNFQRRKILTPFTEKIHFAVLRTMRQVARNNQSFGPEKKQLGQQAMQVIFVNRLRYADPRFAEMSRFTDMQVSNDQGTPLFPEQGSFPAQHQVLVADSV